MKRFIAAVALCAAGSAGATIQTIGDVTDFGDGSYLLASGEIGGPATASAGELETALGLTDGILDALEAGYDGFDDGDVVDGSAIYRSIYLAVGNTVSFDWAWSTNEPIFSLNADFGFVSLSGGPGFEGFAVLADTFDFTGVTSGTFSFTNTIGTGLYTFGIGVVNVDIFDPASNASFLDVNDFVAVPAPAPLMLLALGLVGLDASFLPRLTLGLSGGEMQRVALASAIGAILILILGHGLNMILAGMAVIVHGVRLNMLEYAGHADVEFSGTEYNPFKLNIKKQSKS